MARKKNREEEMPIAEALMRARKTMRPYWYGLEPLLVGIEKGDGYEVFPIDPNFTKQKWMFFFIDPAEPMFETYINLIAIYEERYKTSQVRFLIVFNLHFPSISERLAVGDILRRLQSTIPYTIDKNGDLSKAFHILSPLAAAMISKGTVEFLCEQDTVVEQFEQKLQGYLRSLDPGVPFFPIFKSNDPIPEPALAFDFGVKSTRPPELAEGLDSGPEKLRLIGDWNEQDDHIFTKDRTAKIEFSTSYGSLHLFMQAEKNIESRGKVVIEGNGAPILDVFSGRSLDWDQNGYSVVWVDSPASYFVYRSLPHDRREITLKFPRADKCGIKIFGIRFFNWSF